MLNDATSKITLGNDLDLLADALGEELFPASSRPFETRIVVVPNASFKDFLFHRFATKSRLKMAACVQVLPLNQAVMEILGGAGKKRIPSFLELSLAIEAQLHEICGGREFPSLLTYLGACDGEKRRNRISALSDELARLFAIYGLYGKNLALVGWQQRVWKGVFSEGSPWTYPLEFLKREAAPFHGKIALFGFSYLSFAHLSFFYSVRAAIFQLSPCALFWGDFTSDKQRLSSNRLFKRRGGKELIADELDRYMGQSHPLLGNWGKLGREMLRSLDNFALNESEVYLESDREHLLAKLQASLLTLDESEVLQKDASIQLHSATSKLREVEILRDVLETLLHEHPFSLREILIACPDIPGYAPYIHMVFAQSPFPYAIDGMPIVNTSEAAQGFLQLVQLAEESYALDSVLKLLRCPSFMERRGFALGEINQLCKWFKQAKVRKGLSGNPNSWEQGLDRLLYGLAMSPEVILDVWPVGCIPQSDIDLFNRFLEFFSELKEDLSFFTGYIPQSVTNLDLDSRESSRGSTIASPLVLEIQGDLRSSNPEALAQSKFQVSDRLGYKSASDWLQRFLLIADRYFTIDWEKEIFFRELKSLALSCLSLEEKLWSFENISRVLYHLSQKPVGKIVTHRLEKISFVPFSQGNIVSARIIGCLGMNEGTVPGSDVRSSLCEMPLGQDYFPLKADEDRSLFLDMLLCAKDYLIFSYQRIDSEDGKHQGPSLLIDELDQYLEKRGSGIMKTDHPAFPFDSVYFTPGADVKKWSSAEYLAAKAHYFPRPRTIPFFNLARASDVFGEEITIDIRQLKKLARHPLQFYFNETLKIYLKEEEDEQETDFLISNLRKSMLRKRALRSSLPGVMRESGARGVLPRGLFQAAAMRELEEEVEDLLEKLNEFGLKPDEVSSERLSPLTIFSGSRTIHIVGELEDVTLKGLLVHADNDLKGLVRAWPLYLIYRCLHPENRFLLLTKKGVKLEFPIEDPKVALASYLEYFLLAKSSPSPLMPDWSKAILEENEEGLVSAMSKETDDLYLNYLKRRQYAFDPKEAFSLWNIPFKKGVLDAL